MTSHFSTLIRIGLLLTLNNISDSGAISVTERGCTASISKAESHISDKSVHALQDSFLFRHEKLSATITTTTTTSRQYVKKAISLDLIPAAKQQLCKCIKIFVISLLSLHDLDIKLLSFTFCWGSEHKPQFFLWPDKQDSIAFFPLCTRSDLSLRCVAAILLANTAVGFFVGLVWAFYWYNWPPLAVFFFSSSLQRNYIPQNHPSSELSPQSSLPSQTSHMYIQIPLWHLYSYERQFEGWVQGVVDWVGLVVSVTETWWNVLS